MKAILLAAGRGQRLRHLTEAQPKCLVEVGGRPLLEWQLDALHLAGVDDIVVVRGYSRAQLQDPRYRTIDNAEWATTNMVQSLSCARTELHGDVLIAYTDILYGASLVDTARAASADIACVIDRDWRTLWERRMDDPLADAESLRLDCHGRILDIGQPLERLEDAHGQYVGVIRLSPAGSDLVRGILDRAIANPEELVFGPRPLRHAQGTDLLMRLIADGHSVMSVPIRGGWCEVDSPRDHQVAECLWQEGALPLTAKSTVCAR